MRIEVLRAAARQAVAWRNGGGETREVAVWPAGAGMDAFEWRVSMAEVGVAGPFSVFAGVDRVLTVVSGVLALRFGARDKVLDAESALLLSPTTGGGRKREGGEPIPLAGART